MANPDASDYLENKRGMTVFTSKYYAGLCGYSIKCDKVYYDKNVDSQENYLSLVRELTSIHLANY